MKKKIGIVGLGLIGGSIARALKKQGYEIYGCEQNASALSYALSDSVIDRAVDLNGLKSCQVIFVCVPFGLTRETIEKVYSVVGDDAIITDVASVKSVVKGLPGRIVGGHPMAGTEQSGIWASKTHLFENAYYILTTDTGNAEDLEVVAQLVREMKANPVMMTCDEHDERASKVSHLPHVLAYALSEYALDGGDGLAGTGFMDTTRISASNPDFWTSVSLSNRENLLLAIDEYQKVLSDFKDKIKNNDESALREKFSSASEKRKALVYKRPYLSEYTFSLDIRDEVGTLLKVIKSLTENGINISGIQIVNSREGVGGALRVSVRAESDYEKAKKLFSIEDKR